MTYRSHRVFCKTKLSLFVKRVPKKARFSMKRLKKTALLLLACLSSAQAFSFFITGEGHYGIRPEFRTKPDLHGGANYFGVNQSLRLMAELRAHERASFFAELRLFQSEREARLGKTLKEDSNVFSPVYKALSPRITKAFLRYTMDYAVIEVGRRPRSWAQGLLYDAGEKPFDTYASVFDGVTAYIQPSKSQSLSFMGGYDLIHAAISPYEKTPPEAKADHNIFHQIFGAVSFDTEKLKGTGPISSDTGLYLSHMFDSYRTATDTVTSISFFDAYFNFTFKPIKLSWKNELLGIWGKAAGTQTNHLGSQKEAGTSNEVGSFSVASHLEWTFFEKGSYLGPKSFHKGDYKKTLIYFDFVFLPGMAQGADANGRIAKTNANRAHENFKKTLILFNSKPSLNKSYVDGVFDPYRMMNVHLYSLGVRYEDLKIGNFEGKLTHARLSETHDVADKVGYAPNGTSLGFEVDLSYSMHFGKDVTIGADLGMLVPGNAFKSKEIATPATSFLAQASVIFKI